MKLYEFFADPDKLVLNKLNFAEDESGREVNSKNPLAVRFCPVGAMVKLEYSHKELNETVNKISNVYGSCTSLAGNPHQFVLEALIALDV